MVERHPSNDLVTAFRRELELCKVQRHERMVVLTEAGSRDDFVNACSLVGTELVRELVILTVTGGSVAPFDSTRTGAGPGLHSIGEHTLTLGMLEAADFVVDLTIEGFFHHPVIATVLSAGTRVLYVSDPPEVLARNMTTTADKAAAIAAQNLLSRGTAMTVTSRAGTDLVIDLDDAHPGFQCGFADDPGRWDHWPSAMVTCWPTSSQGTVVLQPGDVILPFKTYIRDEVQLTIEDGRISEISGSSDASFLRRFFEDADDEEARALSHMGWGLMRTGDWYSLAMHDKERVIGQDARSFGGNFLISTGPHPYLGRTTPHHLDIPMRGCHVAVDGRVVVDHGVVVARTDLDQ